MELPLIFLPTISAVIGYFTNWVAIRMLFRPLEEKRLFGIRIPFTPGLIPRKRDDITRNIGQTVADNLFTTEAVTSRLDSEGVRAKIDLAVHNWLSTFLEEEWESIEDLIPAELNEEWNTVYGVIKTRVANRMIQFTRSEQFEHMVHEVVDLTADALWNKRLDQVIGERELDLLIDEMEQSVDKYTSDPQFEAAMEDFWDRKFDTILHKDVQVGDYVPERVRTALYDQLDTLLPVLLRHLAEILDDPGTRKAIKMYLYDLIDDLYEEEFQQDSIWDQLKLGMVETFVLSPEELKVQVGEAVDEGIPKMTALLEREEVRSEVKGSLIDYIEEFMTKNTSNLNLTGETRDEIVETLANLSVSIVRERKIRDVVFDYVENLIMNLSGKELGSFIDNTEEIDRPGLVNRLSEILITAVHSNRADEELRNLVDNSLDRLISWPIGSLRNFIDQDDFQSLHCYLVDGTLKLLKRETPTILSTLDVSALVEAEMKQFSLQEVEDLILDVTGNQLRAITWFGAIIGFLIGLLQLALLWVGG